MPLLLPFVARSWSIVLVVLLACSFLTLSFTKEGGEGRMSKLDFLQGIDLISPPRSPFMDDRLLLRRGIRLLIGVEEIVEEVKLCRRLLGPILPLLPLL